MSVTSGFFNSLNGDRRYDAEQMSAIFEGLLYDGVIADIGTGFQVTASSGNTVTVGIGRGWFNNIWIYNDSILPIEADESELLLDRYDAVIVEIDKSESVRAGNIKIIKGIASSSPQYPKMEHSADVHQYPLAYINRIAGSTSISQANIISMIGTDSCPYISRVLQTEYTTEELNDILQSVFG